jgi:hypothetical protein
VKNTGDTEGRVLLVERGHTLGQYATLSHRWGSHQPLCTTTENYATHAKGILFSDLPATFQDAISVARYLGFHYIWIARFAFSRTRAMTGRSNAPRWPRFMPMQV